MEVAPDIWRTLRRNANDPVPPTPNAGRSPLSIFSGYREFTNYQYFQLHQFYYPGKVPYYFKGRRNPFQELKREGEARLLAIAVRLVVFLT